MHKRKVLIDIAGVLALACVAVILYKLAPSLAGRSASSTSAAPAALVDCDLNARACAADLPDGGHVELAITPRPIPLVRPLTVSARLTGSEAERVDIEFSGVAMDMGQNRVELVAAGGGVYRASAMLPICVSGRMDWRATLRLRSGGRERALAFVFATPEG